MFEMAASNERALQHASSDMHPATGGVQHPTAGVQPPTAGVQHADARRSDAGSRILGTPDADNHPKNLYLKVRRAGKFGNHTGDGKSGGQQPVADGEPDTETTTNDGEFFTRLSFYPSFILPVFHFTWLTRGSFTIIFITHGCTLSSFTLIFFTNCILPRIFNMYYNL